MNRLVTGHSLRKKRKYSARYGDRVQNVQRNYLHSLWFALNPAIGSDATCLYFSFVSYHLLMFLWFYFIFFPMSGFFKQPCTVARVVSSSHFFPVDFFSFLNDA